MIWAILAVVVVVVVVLLMLVPLVAKSKRVDKPDEGFPYEKRDALFTPAERSFLNSCS